jgi:hypothetical protein
MAGYLKEPAYIVARSDYPKTFGNMQMTLGFCFSVLPDKIIAETGTDAAIPNVRYDLILFINIYSPQRTRIITDFYRIYMCTSVSLREVRGKFLI